MLAHEIGHALLLTTGHSTSGLMSGNIVRRDVSFPNEQLALSIRERERLATLFSNTPESERRAVVIEPGPARLAPIASATIPPLR